MCAYRKKRGSENLKWILLRAVALCMAVFFVLGYAGCGLQDLKQVGDLGCRVLHAGSFSEAFASVRNGLGKRSGGPAFGKKDPVPASAQNAPFITLENLPDYTGRSFVVLHRNQPAFSEEFKAKANPYYSFTPLDGLGRCGAAYGKLGPEFLPTKPRGPIGMIKPTGWQYSKYEDIEKKYLYNRCHLLAFQLTGENANKLNLITGTRHFNVVGMLPFENRVAEYIRRTRKHVFYRVTPVFKGNELVARGVTMEALSADDGGKALHYHVFIYNVQPGIEINYANGKNRRKE